MSELEDSGAGRTRESPTALDPKRAEAARTVLERVFASVDPGVRYRLWDGTEGEVGRPDGSFTLIVRDPDTFRECFSTQNTKVMAEAFVDDRIEVEGDLFAALRVANQLEDVRIGWAEKLRLAALLRRI